MLIMLCVLTPVVFLRVLYENGPNPGQKIEPQTVRFHLSGYSDDHIFQRVQNNNHMSQCMVPGQQMYCS